MSATTESLWQPRGLTWLAVAAAATSLVIGCGARQAGTPSRPGSRSAAGGVVPWADRPASAYTGPAPVKVLANARPCRPADVRVSRGRAGVGLGNTNVELDFVNRSPSPCLLAGYPSVAGLSASGVLTPLRARHGSYFGDPGPTANIATGQSAAVNVSGADACQAAQDGQRRVYPALRIGLPGGGAVQARAVGFDAICGVSVSRFGVPADLPKPPAPSPLTARITAAATVRPGEDFGYRVTLANPTATAFRLVPCPAYEEYVVPITGRHRTTGTGYVVRYYYLNCDAVHQIGAHSSVTYQMRLRLPAGLPAGVPAKFVWLLQGADTGPGTSAPLRIIG